MFLIPRSNRNFAVCSVNNDFPFKWSYSEWYEILARKTCHDRGAIYCIWIEFAIMQARACIMQNNMQLQCTIFDECTPAFIGCLFYCRVSRWMIQSWIAINSYYLCIYSIIFFLNIYKGKWNKKKLYYFNTWIEEENFVLFNSNFK